MHPSRPPHTDPAPHVLARLGRKLRGGDAPPLPERTSETLEALVGEGGAARISITTIVEALRGRAFGMLLFIFALPSCFPMPPGIPSFSGIMIMLIGVHLVVGAERLWLPRVVAARSIERERLGAVVTRIVPALRRLERLSRPRIPFASARAGKALVGIVALVLGFILILPIPFIGNIPPAIAAAVIGIGITERDGVMVLAGFAAATFAVAVNSAFVWGAIEAIGYFIAKTVA
jgi:hypothetical protein